MAMVFAAIAAIATVLTLAMPLLASDALGKRMKAVAVEREKMRQRERERMARGEKVALRRTPKQYMQTVVDQFNLGKWVGQEEARQLLVQAGYRGHAPYIAFLFFRLVVPAVLLLAQRVLRLLRARAPLLAGVEDRHLNRGDLSGHVSAGPVHQEQDPEAPAVDQAGVPGRARPASDLRGIRHVDRSCLQEGCAGNRLTVDPACRGAY